MIFRILDIKFSLLSACLFASFFSLPNNTLGQEAKVALEPKSILIGEHVNMTLEVEAPPESDVVFPDFSDKVNTNIEIINYGNVVEDYSDDRETKILKKEYTVTAYQEGHFPIEPIEFKSIIDGDTLTFMSEAKLISVETVEIDPEEGPKDVKPIIQIPWTFSELLPYILLVLLVITIVLFIIYYLKQRKKKPEPSSIWERADVPAYAAALSKLEALRKSNYLKEEKFKLFYSELTDILRRYLEKHFEVDAPEMTSNEILLATKELLEKEDHDKLNDMLVLADLVKFAKHKPMIDESEQRLNYAFEIVKNTIPMVDEEQTNNNQ